VRECDATPLTPVGSVSVHRLAAESIASMREFHQIAIQRVKAQSEMASALIRVRGHDKVRDVPRER
jgi:hypothetical protein